MGKKRSSDERVWLAADVPSEVAERFRAKAREEDRSARSARAQLRRLIGEYAGEPLEHDPRVVGTRDVA